MGVTYISRDYRTNVSMVGLTTTDTTAIATNAGYITSQFSNIANANNAGGAIRPFQWFANDAVLLSASDGLSLCSINSTFTTLIPFATQAPSNGNGEGFTVTTFNYLRFQNTIGNGIELVPPQGANTLILFDRAALIMTNSPSAFTANGQLNIQYSTNITAYPASDTISSNPFQQSDHEDVLVNFLPLNSEAGGYAQINDPANPVLNQGLYLQWTQSDPTGGADALFTVYTWYRVLNNIIL